jgi:hypothetical protein
MFYLLDTAQIAQTPFFEGMTLRPLLVRASRSRRPADDQQETLTMTETLLLPDSDVLSPEATDESLIDAARQLNASYNGHLKRSIEDFWRLGETLSHLFQRRHLKGRWADILSDIGINVTTDNHARRLFQATTLDGLSEFKNKTQALRFFGILSTPTTSVKMPVVSSPEASDDESEENSGSPGGEQTSVSHQENGLARARTAERPERRISESKKRRAVEHLQAPDESDDDRTPPSGGQPTVKGTYDSLEVLAKIAKRLEYLAADRIDVTADHLTHIDRMLRASEVIRSKGVVDAA